MRSESREEEVGAPSCGDAVSFLKKPSASWRRRKSFLLVRNRLAIKDRHSPRPPHPHPEKGTAINVCHFPHTSNWAGKVAQCMEQQSHASLCKRFHPWLWYECCHLGLCKEAASSPRCNASGRLGEHTGYIATYLLRKKTNKQAFTTQSIKINIKSINVFLYASKHLDNKNACLQCFLKSKYLGMNLEKDVRLVHKNL